ncbi:MAG: hypothetical protein ACP5N9_00535 [Candidatus Bilamarchaeum sp.]|jgi:hypothetical protein
MSLGNEIADEIGEKVALGTVEIILGVIIAVVVAVVLLSLGLPQNSIDKFFEAIFNLVPTPYRGFFGLFLFGLLIIGLGIFFSLMNNWIINRKKKV